MSRRSIAEPGGQAVFSSTTPSVSDPDAADADLERLESILASGGAVRTRDYVALVRRVGRHRPDRLRALGVEMYAFGLRQGFADGDNLSLIELARLSAMFFDAIGEHEQTIASLTQAGVMLSSDPGGRALMLAMRMFQEASAGRVGQARRLADEYAPAIGTDVSTDIDATVAMTQCLLLELANVEALEGPAEAARAEGDDPAASSLMVQIVSAFAACGRIAEAADRASGLRAYATEVGHRARQVDAEVALLALRGRRERVDEPEGLAAEAERLMNNHALWKLLVCLYRQHLLRDDSAAAERVHGLLVKHYGWLNPGYRNSFEGLDAYRRALFDERSVIDLPTPDSPTLLSVDNVLASAEAVAIGGSFATAAEWIAWLEAELPAEVVTSLEWPACRARVEGLLLLRVGQRSEAIERLRAAIERCEGRGYTIEAEIGRAQLAAVTADDEAAVLAAGRLDDVGIDALPFAASARRIAARAERAGDPLTVNEARVLARVAGGLTYREIEADLGVPARAISKVLTASYAKLGAGGRIAAVQVARDRLIV